MKGTIRDMPKKRKPGRPSRLPASRVVLYLEVEEGLKERLARLADLPQRRRTITAEATIGLLRYLEEEEAKEGLPPLEGQP